MPNALSEIRCAHTDLEPLTIQSKLPGEPGFTGFATPPEGGKLHDAKEWPSQLRAVKVSALR